MIERMSKNTYKLLDTQTSEFMIFEKYKHEDKKTFEIVVWAADGYTALGEIKWRYTWRKYAFYPCSSTLFDSKCLKEITKYIDDLMEARKK